ncbi:MAG: hypothetical protein C4534_05265 [Gaiellales bacterium]|nr:MAG: hypothetical protein C4534_05265 [Gaiellales bacterium]
MNTVDAIRQNSGGRARLLAALTVMLLAALAAAPAGCGGDGGDTGTQPARTAATAATDRDDGPSPAEVDAYVEQVRELVHVSDQLNGDYRFLVERYNSGESPDEDVITQAESNAIAYRDMKAQLEGMRVPEGMEDAHGLIVSGFGKWREMYELDARGVRDKDSALLDRARKLDSEAVADVNDGISEINRLKN